MQAGAVRRLTAEFRNMIEKPTPGVIAAPKNEDDLLKWSFTIAGPVGSPYAFGIFNGELHFPSDYPLSPPKMIFTTPITHPNVYQESHKRGEVCISILHTGRDITNYERNEERWSPVQSVESILLSVMSMLAEPNCESPANVDAAKLLLNDVNKFNSIVKQEVKNSLNIK